MSEGRGLLTESERRVLLEEGSDSHRSKTKTYVRRRLKKIDEDADILRKTEPNLLAGLMVVSCGPETSNPTFRGEHREGLEYVFYKDDNEWDQEYFDSSSISWGEGGGKTGIINTAKVLLYESLVEGMTFVFRTLLEFASYFGIDNNDTWEVTAAEVRQWYKDEVFYKNK